MKARPLTSAVAVQAITALVRYEAGAASEKQPTPGQWYAAAWSCHAKTTVVVDDPTVLTGKRVIAECETEEDARLTAAARELLAACERAEQWLEGWASAETELAVIRAAISKAKP
jgi:hypothetical protein